MQSGHSFLGHRCPHVPLKRHSGNPSGSKADSADQSASLAASQYYLCHCQFFCRSTPALSSDGSAFLWRSKATMSGLQGPYGIAGLKFFGAKERLFDCAFRSFGSGEIPPSCWGFGTSRPYSWSFGSAASFAVAVSEPWCRPGLDSVARWTKHLNSHREC